MKKLTTKISIIAALTLCAVLPTQASASVSGSVQCPQGKTVETYVQGFGWFHYHQLNGTPRSIIMPDPYTSYYTIIGWNAASGNWQVSTSTTTTYGAGYCV